MDKKRFYKTEGNDAMLGGVCGGIAEYFDVDPTIIRIAFAFLVFAVGTGILFYVVAYLLMPKKSDVIAP